MTDVAWRNIFGAGQVRGRHGGGDTNTTQKRNSQDRKRSSFGGQSNQLEEVDPTQETHLLTREQRRTLHQQIGRKSEQGDDKSSLHVLDISASELIKLQDQGETLAKVRDSAEGKPSTAGVGLFRQDSLIFRRWTPPGLGEEMEIENLVLLKECRRTVLELVHDILLVGHLGKEKTRQQVLRFYWLTVFKDVNEFC